MDPGRSGTVRLRQRYWHGLPVPHDPYHTWMQSVVCRACDHTGVESDLFCAQCGARMRPVSDASPPESSRERAVLDALRKATLGEYEIREELGRGGMATVYLAHEMRLNKKVALKVLSPHVQMVPGMAARFLREAQTAAALEHPNIIPIYAYRESADFVFFTMRYMEGASLYAIAKQVGAFPIAVVRALLADVGGALAFAHAHGVLHRDVKPANVLIGRDGAAMVTDFGIAKQADGEGLTLTGQFLGTPGYMSPEQCRGRDLSPASDQYALGVMAFELLAGQIPFTGTAVGELMAQHLTQQPPDLRELRSDCPRDLAAAVMRMLAKSPHERFTSIDEALAAARAHLVLPSDPARVQLRKWVENPVHARNLANTPISPTPRRPDAPAQAAASATQFSTPTPRRLVPLVREVDPIRWMRSRWLMAVVGAVATSVVIAILASKGGGQPGNSDPLPPPPPQPTSGALVVSQLPAAGTAFVDGARVEGGRMELSPGEHRVRLEAPGYAVTDTVIQVVAGDTVSLTFAAPPLKPVPATPVPVRGTLVVTGLPTGGSIRVDGRRVSSRVELDAGQHAVRLQAPGFVSVDTTVRVAVGETRTLAFASERVPAAPATLPPAPAERGVLMLRVRPFAKVFVDGVLAVEDERLVVTLTEGRHTLRFEKAGFVPLDTAVTVPRADTLRRLFTLQPRTP